MLPALSPLHVLRHDLAERLHCRCALHGRLARHGRARSNSCRTDKLARRLARKPSQAHDHDARQLHARAEVILAESRHPGSRRNEGLAQVLEHKLNNCQSRLFRHLRRHERLQQAHRVITQLVVRRSGTSTPVARRCAKICARGGRSRWRGSLEQRQLLNHVGARVPGGAVRQAVGEQP